MINVETLSCYTSSVEDGKDDKKKKNLRTPYMYVLRSWECTILGLKFLLSIRSELFAIITDSTGCSARHTCWEEVGSICFSGFDIALDFYQDVENYKTVAQRGTPR